MASIRVPQLMPRSTRMNCSVLLTHRIEGEPGDHTSPEPSARGVCLLEGDLPHPRVERKQLLHGGAPDTTPPSSSGHEELAHQARPGGNTPHEGEPHGAAVELEHVDGAIPVVRDVGVETAGGKGSLHTWECPAKPRGRMLAAELGQIVLIQLPEPLEHWPVCGNERSQVKCRGHLGQGRQRSRAVRPLPSGASPPPKLGR